MNRIEEYNALLEELDNTPIQLDYTLQRVTQRNKKCFIKKFFMIPASSCIGFLMIFTLLVNCVPVFAYTCGSIPGLRKLAKLVAVSPSLSAAVENKYVQPIESEQTKDGVTARIEYVIVDQKQLNIFYSLHSEVYGHLDAYPSISSSDKEQLEGYSLSYGDPNVTNGELNYITLDFVDTNMPSKLNLTLEVYDQGEPMKTAFIEDDMFLEKPPSREEKVEAISEFTFELSFDPYYTAQGEWLDIYETFLVDGETLVLETADIYPTHMRFMLDDIESNTAWLTSLDFYLENEKGKRFEKISNGITATGKKDSPMMASHRLESAFFSDSKELTMYIMGVEWLDKDMEKLKLNLKDVTAEKLPEGVVFEKAEKRLNGWLLTFAAKEYKENHFYQIWSSSYYDEEGKSYDMMSWSTGVRSYFDEETGKSIDTPGVFRVEIPLVNYSYDTVYLTPNFSRRVQLEEPIAIKIK